MLNLCRNPSKELHELIFFRRKIFVLYEKYYYLPFDTKQPKKNRFPFYISKTLTPSRDQTQEIRPLL